MADDTQAAIARYIELKSQISGLEKELDAIKDEVLNAVTTAGGEVAQDNVTLKKQQRPKYKFSEDYETKNAQLSEQKKAEIKEGIATIEGYSEFVTLKIKKEK